ncbi:hypothetical protein [Bacillus alkalicellulosilyticus]|uniref:hypothetical protein n=1 Tax=Alkalihalobacterium alkalicellulosilyticum TaxID=1912214 RepID=UPI0009978F48|nr:hypothetical protein [Bacillus alkalicellulosilyticus]
MKLKFDNSQAEVIEAHFGVKASSFEVNDKELREVNGGCYTTMAIGEEDGSFDPSLPIIPIRPIKPIEVTTMAIGEEDGGII